LAPKSLLLRCLPFGLLYLSQDITKADNFFFFGNFQFQVNLSIHRVDERIKDPVLFIPLGSIVPNGLSNQHGQIPSLKSVGIIGGNLQIPDH